MRMGPHMMMSSDAEAVRGKKLQRSSLARAWQFARPYRGTIGLFLSAIVAAAAIDLVPPFAFRTILNDAIPESNRGLITTLAAVVVAAALHVGDVIVTTFAKGTATTRVEETKP